MTVLVLLAAALVLSVPVCTARFKDKTANPILTPAEGESDQEMLLRIAKTFNPITDKFTAHAYQEMYGYHMIPKMRELWAEGHQIKFLEIGLGCCMTYGPGASANVWKSIFKPTDTLWFAESDEECVKKSKAAGQLRGFKVVVGDQANPETVNHWVKQIGTPLDIIIDDGGHSSTAIMTSFVRLWPLLAPGGLYFIEDLLVNLMHPFTTSEPLQNAVDYINSWIFQLQMPYEKIAAPHLKIPSGIKWISCQAHACVIAKCKINDVATCSP